MAGSSGMILVRYGCPEQGHDPIARELYDRALVTVDLVHQEPEAAVYEAVHIFRVEVLRNGRVVNYVSEEDGDELPFALNRAAVIDDLLCQELGRVGPRLGIIEGRGLRGKVEVETALVTEAGLGQHGLAALGTDFFELYPALEAESREVPVFKVAGRALHHGTFQGHRHSIEPEAG
jgi:hypothetical protein